MIEGGVIEMDASYKNENVKFLIQNNYKIYNLKYIKIII